MRTSGFLLEADDPLAPFLVSIWAAMMLNDLELARARFETMTHELKHLKPDPSRAHGALLTARELQAQQKEADRDDL